MKGGDLSNETPRRSIFVWEGLLAFPPKRLPRFRATPLKIVKAHDPNIWAFKQVWDMLFRHKLNYSIVTYLGSDYIDPIAAWCDIYSLGQAEVLSMTPEQMAQMAHAPWIDRIYDGDSSRWATYGSRGVIVDPETFSWKA